MKLVVTAELPEELAQDFHQHVRDYDAAHPGCHFEIILDAPGLTVRQLVEAMQVDPPLPFQTLIERATKKP
jgi:hypothetical protein